MLNETPLTSQDVPGEMQAPYKARLEAYIERGKAFKSRQGTVAGSLETWKRRNASQREIASTIALPDIELLAHAIAWSQGPYGVTRDAGEEATWAEGLVRDPANQAATPYLYAFLASRYRLQFEGADEDRALLERLAKKYKTMLERVRNAGDPLFVLLADDLDARAGLSPGATATRGSTCPRRDARSSGQFGRVTSALPRSPRAAPAHPASRRSDRTRSPCRPCRSGTC